MQRSIVLVALVLTLASPALAEPYTIVDSSETQVGNLVRTEWVVQEGDNPLNRFTVYRVIKKGAGAGAVGSAIFLPPLGNHFGFYELAESGDYLDSFAAFMAKLHVDVWGYSPRATGLPADVCATTDCGVMADWGMATIVEDVEYIRAMVQERRPGVKPAVGGFSLGAIAALAVINAHPQEYRAAIVFDGMIASSDPVVQAYNAPFCLGYDALLAGGVVYDGQTNAGLFAATALAQNAPADPSPIISGLTNHQALVFFLSVHQDAPNQPHPEYIIAAGDAAAGTFQFLDEDRLFAGIGAFNAGFANRELRDLSCGLAGLETSFSSNLGAFDGPVLLLSAGRAFGLFSAELHQQLAGAAVTELRYEAMGHVDPMMSPYHHLLVELPIFAFLLAL